MTDAEIIAVVHRGLAANEGGWLPGGAVARQWLTELVGQQCVAKNANESARNAVAAVRRLAGTYLPPAVEVLVGPFLDKLDVAAADPANGQTMADGAKSIVMPWLNAP